MTGSFLLQSTLFLPASGAIGISLLPDSWQEAQKAIALLVSILTFLLSLVLWVLFDNATPEFQFVTQFPGSLVPSFNLIPGNLQSEEVSGSKLRFGVDGISLLLIVLTTLLIPICLLLTWDQGSLGQSVSRASDKKVSGTFGRLLNLKVYLAAFLFLESLLIGVFTVLDVFVFYLLFESVLVPMYLIIGVWGSRERKIKASYQFFLYTLFGSLLMLLGILILYFQTGTTDLLTLYLTKISSSRQSLLWLAFFFSFAIKVPMVPLHLWLPEAHVEAPTSGSVILAGVLLKLGTYGFLRYSLPLFPEATAYFAPMVTLLSLFAILFGSLTTLRQVDLKKIIAYSSVAHMGYITLGIFAGCASSPTPLSPTQFDHTGTGIEGALFLMLSHGVVSSGLFLCVGLLYERYGTRLLQYYGGLAQVMPVFSTLFLVFTLANLSLPTTSNFVGEFLVLIEAYTANTLLGVLASFGMVLGAAYSIWMYNRVVFGPRPKIEHLTAFVDINRREALTLLPLLLLVFWMGIYPDVFLQTFHSSAAHCQAMASYR